MTNKVAIKLSKFIAHYIFTNVHPPGTVTRIEFKTGKWPEEKGAGGLCERALQVETTNAIREFFRPTPKRKKRGKQR
jgi:hypothetical protein